MEVKGTLGLEKGMGYITPILRIPQLVGRHLFRTSSMVVRAVPSNVARLATLKAGPSSVNLYCSLFGLFVLAMSNMAYDIGKLINLKLKI